MSAESDFLFLKAVTFAKFSKKGELLSRESLHCFKSMIKKANVNAVVLPIIAYAKNAQSCEIDYKTDTPSDFEIENFVDFAHRNSVRVVIKPVVSLLNGTNCCYIDFLGQSPEEPSWGEWFDNYAKFVLHLSKLAAKTCTSVFCCGSGLSRSECRENEWRSLIAAVREIYGGYLTYESKLNFSDKINFWDALNFITVSAPIKNIETTLKNITSKNLDKPFALSLEFSEEDLLLQTSDFYKKLFDKSAEYPTLCEIEINACARNPKNVKNKAACI